MKKIVSIIAIAGFSFLGVAIAEAGDVAERRDHSSFEKIVIDNTGVSIDVAVGKDFSVTVKGSEEWVKDIQTEVDGDSLIISKERKNKKSLNFDSDNTIVITMPKFVALKVNGAVDADISGIESDKVAFDIKGAANLEVKGTCGRLRVDMSGAGNFEGRHLKCKDVEVEIGGAGNAEIYASESVELEIGGFGNIDVYGKPKDISKESHMFSNITIHD